MTERSNRELANYIDHTLLKPDASQQAIEQLCEEAVRFGFHSVCVHSYWVSRCQALLNHTQVKIAAVVGFPLGAQMSEVKAYEAACAVQAGAREIDMVVPIGLLMDGEETAVYQDVLQVVQAVQPVHHEARVKVILETGYLSDEQKRLGCQLAERAGAQWVKTSTGFGPGGATVEDIRLMRSSVSSHIGVKASGGVRDRTTLIQMIEAGATRIGTSSGVAIMQSQSGLSAY